MQEISSYKKNEALRVLISLIKILGLEDDVIRLLSKNK